MAQPSTDDIEQVTGFLHAIQAEWRVRHRRQEQLVSLLEQPGQSAEVVAAAAAELRRLLEVSAQTASAVQERLAGLFPPADPPPG